MPLQSALMTRRSLAALAAGIILLLGCSMGEDDGSGTTVTEGGEAATASAAAADAKAPTAALGSTLTVKTRFPESEVAYTLAAAQAPAKTDFGTGPDKGQFLAFTATIVITSGSTYACACNFAVVDPTGTVYEYTGMSFKGSLQAVSLGAPGQRASGLVVFDVPKGATAGWKVELRDGLGGQSRGSWTL